MFLQIQRSGNNEWWRWLVVVVFLFLGMNIGQIPLLIAAVFSGNQNGIDFTESMRLVGNYDFKAVGLHENLTLFLIILGFAGTVAGLWFGMKFIHGRPFKTLISPFQKINWGKILFSFGFWMGLAVLIELGIYLSAPDTYSMRFQPANFIGLLLVTVLFLPIQTSCEELVFRGYLMQGLALIAPIRIAPLVITSVLFGVMHFANPEVEAFGLVPAMTYYIGVGLFLGIVTLMDDSLELALGIHAATNIFGALFVTYDNAVLQTSALFHTSELNMTLMIVGFLIAAFIYLLVVSKKYKWKDWSRLYGKVEKPHLSEV